MKRIAAILLLSSPLLLAQAPLITTPTHKPRVTESKSYPWKKNITATIFWIGEKPTPKNPTPNHASSWDTKWQSNFGGFDDPNSRAVVGYRPAAFTPKLNPFYIALPYNDRVKCFAQWEDCGPFNTVDYQYVFGNKPPMNSKNQGAGIDLSPAIRDYLSLTSGDKVHWRFVEDHQIPHGPWKTYGKYVSTQPVSNETRVEAYNRKMKEFNEKIEAERQERIRRLDAMISKSEPQ